MITSYKNKGKADGDWSMNDMNFVRDVLYAKASGTPMAITEGSQWHAKYKHQMAFLDKLPAAQRDAAKKALYTNVTVVPKKPPPPPVSSAASHAPQQQRRPAASASASRSASPAHPVRPDRTHGTPPYGFTMHGLPNMQLGVNRSLYCERGMNFGGGPDMRLSENRVFGLNKDGSPDMRCKMNRT